MKNYEVHGYIRLSKKGNFEALVSVKVPGFIFQMDHIKAPDKKTGFQGLERFFDRVTKEKNKYD
jgi:hypothetical protein